MSHGTRDYWPSINLSIFGEGYTDKVNAWFKYGTITLDKNENALIITYTVPADTILVIGSAYFGCRYPGINRILINRDAEILCDFPYDVYGVLPPAPWGLYRFVAGQELYARIFNTTGLNGIIFTATFTGYTEVIT